MCALSDSKQFTVECASKGLAYCFEKSTAGVRSNLVSELMGTLRKGKRIVHSDTEVETKEG